jgi:predicted DCC family thiol-disulfide oxidoreductase YuxK
MMPERSTVLFDGDCSLCNGVVRFLLKRDRERAFQFAPLQSTAGRAILQAHGRRADDLDTLVLVDRGSVLIRSDAVLAIAARLPPPWRAARFLAILPRPLRDGVYRVVARYRNILFRGQDRCVLPVPGDDRFLDGSPPLR